MIKSPMFVIICLTFSACLLLAGTGLTSNDGKYDPDEYGPEEPVVWDNPVKSIFDHKVHTMDAGLDCSSCHDEIFPQEHDPDTKYTMEEMADGKSCGSCHDGDTAFDTKSDCLSCHVVTDKLVVWDKTTKTSFSHTLHINDFDLECTSCHGKIFEHKKDNSKDGSITMADINNGMFCGYCHDSNSAFDAQTQCEACHSPPTQKIIFNQPVETVVFDHNVHVAKGKLSCVLCHREVFTMKKGAVEEQKLSQSEDPAVKRKYLVDLHNRYCGSCHDSSQAFGYLTRCTVCHIGVKGKKELEGGKKEDASHGKSSH